MTDEPRCNTCGMSYSTPERLRLANAALSEMTDAMIEAVEEIIYWHRSYLTDDTTNGWKRVYSRLTDLIAKNSQHNERAERIDDLLESVREAGEQ